MWRMPISRVYQALLLFPADVYHELVQWIAKKSSSACVKGLSLSRHLV